MGTPAQVAPGYYVWQVPGKPVVVHLNLNVVDRLAAEIMRGYGAVPKRGAEVGGVLIGSMEGATGEAAPGGEPHIVKVEDFTAVPCDYRRGPSYLFTDEDGHAFERAFAQPGVIGYFRSHTRDGLSLTDEDLELLDHFFPGPTHVALVVKPFASKVSTASFFIRESGAFPAEPALEFPFRRGELTGEGPPGRRALIDPGPRRRERPPANGRAQPPPNQDATDPFPASDDPSSEFTPPAPANAYTSPAEARAKNWYWIPLSFAFLLLGLFLGFQIALSVGSRVSNSGAREFSLNLSVAKGGDNLSVKWDGQSAAVRASERGTLEITDGAAAKRVELDAAQLKSGSLLYRGLSRSVRFRLTVYPDRRVSVSEAVEWK